MAARNHIIHQNNSALATASQLPGAVAEQWHAGDSLRARDQQIGWVGRGFHLFFNYRASQGLTNNRRNNWVGGVDPRSAQGPRNRSEAENGEQNRVVHLFRAATV